MLGKTLGHYRILEKIGAGGMGEVYRARDDRLGRDVAIKVLPETLARDSERVARFEREAHLLASLNHPHIAAIYGLEEANGLRFLVLELVPGATLAETVAVEPLSLKDAVALARQIAEALEAAHEKGIIHRDLKPANINVTPDGKVKVLDFGLAKDFEGEGQVDVSKSPTISEAATRSGAILGTAAYMSPEQARGKPLDKRTDIWSFGCVLYEALTGCRAFPGETVSDTIAAVLDREPNWQSLPLATPPGVQRLLRRCLEKDLRRRLHDIADARLELEDAGAEPAAALRPLSLGGWAMVVLAVAVGALATWLVLRAARTPGEAILEHVARLTHDPGLSEWPSWSPDGSLLAFASNRSGNFEIYVRRVEGGQEVNVTNDAAEDFQPAFSPDGNSIAFVSTRSSRMGMVKIGSFLGFEFRTYGGDIWVVPTLGGPARRLARDGNFPVCHPDGRKLAYVSGREDHRSILEVSVEGGTPKPVLPTESSTWEIVRLQYSPDGSWISFDSVNPERVLLMPASGGTPRELFSGSSHVWDPSGRRIYYLSKDQWGGTRIQALAIDLQSGNVVGPPHTVGLMTGILRALAVARNGRQFVVSSLEEALNLTRLPLTPAGDAPAGPEQQLSSGQVIDRYPAFSPDGRRVAFASNRLRPQEVWILDIPTKHIERLRPPGEDAGTNLPVWSRDGRQLAVTRFYPDGRASLWLAAVDGSSAEELVPPRGALRNGPFSPAGRSLLYSYRKDGYMQLFVFDLASRRERQLTTSSSDKYDAAWSPDGRAVIFSSNAAGALQVEHIPAEGGEQKVLTSGPERIRHVFYSPDGRWIYFQPNHQNIYRMPAGGGPPQRVTRFPESGLFLEEPTMSPDGRYLAYCRSNGGSSLWVLTLESGRPAPRPAANR